MKEFFKKISGSFDMSESGYSSRKLTAFIIIVCVISIHIKWIALGDFKQIELVLTIDYSFIASLFGMTTYQYIKSKKDDEK
tara:strand:+ start:477 stop:719 length:243 start_codon:yes stop_codon:yes gene_type:complete